ncbi:hypothetical protein JGL56_00745 [Salmonella enterica subsp. enterica serovar Derby]|uniref:hypothetical protein n=1 Tax=Enterobacter TaxID=547 RepID=UPI00084F93B8|nr:hypothetical protein [Enterobacter sp. ku-bf2]MBJ5866248.1 hypothetical protein [Salmonella enterica subsp. enterica serovar Derby]OEI77348.1 hypothetical protein BFG58_02055 [Enterobacter sp. ku-bf2]HDR2371315.1 hypothetical protein [Enterobacter asburiae]
MKIVNEDLKSLEIPTFATTAAAASYKVGTEGYVDLMFMRSHFIIDNQDDSSPVVGKQDLHEQRASLVFSRVAAVTMTAEQAKALIANIELQLNNLEKV